MLLVLISLQFCRFFFYLFWASDVGPISMGTASRLCQCHLDQDQAPFSVLDQNQFLSFARHSKKGFSSILYVWIAMSKNSGHGHHEENFILSTRANCKVLSMMCVHSEIHCSVWSRAEHLCVQLCSVQWIIVCKAESVTVRSVKCQLNFDGRLESVGGSLLVSAQDHRRHHHHHH